MQDAPFTRDAAPLGEAVLMPITAYEASPIEWLWPGRIPIGKVTLMAGDPGLGKSFVSLDLAARASAGLAMPGESIDGKLAPLGPNDEPVRCPGSVVLLSAEDDPGDTIRPRLEAMNADLANIRVIPGVHGENEAGRHVMRLTELDRDMARLHRALERIDSPRLVIIDPISAYMGQTDSHNNSQVRTVMAELGRLAAHHRVAVVCVTHLNKRGEGGRAVYRTMGSLAFAAAARVVLLVAKHPEDENKRVVMTVKSNVGREATSLAYQIVETLDTGASLVHWLDEEVPFTADELERCDEGIDALSDAGEWLSELLRCSPGGQVETSIVLKEAEAAGFPAKTLRRAKRRLGVQAKRESLGNEGGGRWVWRLPIEAAAEAA
jgi:RecA/RadA recombinase